MTDFFAKIAGRSSNRRDVDAEFGRSVGYARNEGRVSGAAENGSRYLRGGHTLVVI